MPWCPKCGAEYRINDICLSCNERLVEQKPTPAKKETFGISMAGLLFIWGLGALFLHLTTYALSCVYGANFDHVNPFPAVVIPFFCYLTPAFMLGFFFSNLLKPWAIRIGWILALATLIYPHYRQLSLRSDCDTDFSALIIILIVASVGSVATLHGRQYCIKRKWWNLAIPVLWFSVVAVSVLCPTML